MSARKGAGVRVNVVRAGAVALALVVAAGVVPPAAAGPSAVYALGGPAVLPAETLARVEAQTGHQAVRLAGPNRFATAVAVSRHAHPAGTATVYLASGRDHADALAAAAPVAAEGAGLLLVEPHALPAVAAEELARLEPERIVVLGGPAAVGEVVVDQVRAATGVQPTRVAGTDRFTTAAAISAATFPDGADTVYLATGRGHADALAAATAVTVDRAALLPVEPDRVPAVVADELRRLRPEQIVVLGGTTAVTDQVVTEVAQLTGARPTRLAGADRYATAAAIADHAHPDGADTVYVATGRDYADALAAAPAVAANRGAIKLVKPPQEVRWLPQVAAAREYAASRQGSVSFAAIGTDGRMVGHRSDTPVPAASVLKVMFMVAYLRQPDVRDRPLTRQDRDLLEPMIRHSANEPATRIADLLGPQPMLRLAERAGMRDFSYTRPWGQTRTSARDQVRFLLDLPRHIPPRHRDEALRLLTEIAPEQQWGVGQVATPGWTKHFKGGWGSGTGAMDHQVALLRHDRGARTAVAVMITASPSHEYGKATLHGTFHRLLADLPG
jgi:putative cell wall-binding protein